MKIIGVIPARYNSSRFEGKPLADISGKPMIWWVYQEAKKVKKFDEIVVATDNEEILKVCESYNINVMMTSINHPTGTDRVVEVAKKIDGDLYIVVMGDEPLIRKKDIESLINDMVRSKAEAGMLGTKFKNAVDVINWSTIKLAINDRNELIYMSRSAIPYPKATLDYDYYKNVGVYAFTKDVLHFFENTKRGRLEKIEDMEMLRMLENHKRVSVSIIDTDAMSVDTPKDLERIKSIMKDRGEI